MKNIYFASIVLMILFSCKKDENSTKKEISNKTEIKNIGKDSLDDQIIVKSYHFKLDSIKVEDSLLIKGKLNYDSNYSLLIFPEIKNKTLLDSIYAPISKDYDIKIDKFSKKDLLLMIKKISEKNKKEYFSEVKDIDNPILEYIAYDSFGMSINSVDNDFVTINYGVEGMSPGAAHPFHNSKLITFDFKNNKQIHLDDILKIDKKTWNKIVSKYIPKDLVFEEYQKEIPKTENFYFDKKYIYFCYNEYEIGPYVSGLVEVRVPFSELKFNLKKGN